GNISLLVIGGGRIGMEAVKAACWCGQVANHRLEIHVVDMDEYAESRFLNKCPGFATYMDDPNIQEKFLIEFHHINVEHREFTEFMQKHPDIGYVICALGDEELNLQIAADIRCNYERIGHKKNAYGKRLPLINTLISNPFLHEVGGKLKNVQNQEYELNPFGNVKNLYTWKLISGTYLDQLAYGIHRIYDDGREEEARERFESSEYNRKASIVSALHCKYKLYSSLGRENEKIASDDNSRIWRNHPTDNMIEAYIRYITALDTVEPDRNKVSRIRIEELAKLEHKRWNMYMLTEGFLPATMDEFRSYYRLVSNHKNMIAKKHPGIVLWDKLDEVSSFVSDTMKKEVNLKEEDRKIVKSIPQILWQNSNSERSAEMRARLLMHKAPPVRHIQFDSSGKAKENFTVLLIGFGVNGQQLLRTLMMNSQFYGSTFSVAVVDDNVEEKRIRFQKQYGGLLSAYHVVFYEMKKLHKTLNHIKNIQLPEVKYMVICKEFDIDNERIFDIFQESNPWESVEPYFMNGAISEEQIYQYASMEKMAMLVNYNYAKMGGQSDSLEKLWEDTDFHSRQSCRASSDFIRSMYHIAGFDIGLERVTEEVFQERVKGELLENLSRTEHLRWNAFHYTMGYSAMSMREVQERACNGIKPYQKDVENKKHACITEWDELDELSALMSKLTGKQIDYKEADRANVMNMPRTLNG
ncbi:MAG: hypothetical protein VB095_06220, partial [Anaerovorax sp.]|nr:hypothetical protein [Anaerovorax sp.]